MQVSLVRILANPDKYDGKRVVISGYLHDKFEDSAIYLSKDDADHLHGENGLWVDYSSGDTKYFANTTDKTKDRSYFDCRYVKIEGTFNKDGHGHLGMWAGEIKDVVQISESVQWFDGAEIVTSPGSLAKN